MDMTAQPIEVHLRTDVNNLVTTAASTPSHACPNKEAIHMIQMFRQEACSGQMHDLVHVVTHLADPLTKKSVSPSLLISTVQTGGSQAKSSQNRKGAR